MIYLVEDDNSIRELVIYTLQSTGFEARGFACGADFWEGMKEDMPELVLLDIMLPDEDGLSILRKLRGTAATQKLPVMMLTAKGTEYDKVIGLDSGADDYLPKPFGMMELVSRVRALLRRTAAAPEKVRKFYQIGLVSVDVEKHEVLVDGNPVTLTYKEFELLKLFLSNPGTAFTRDKLMEEVWSTDYCGETRTVDMHIRTLRQKLGRFGEMIKTVRGVGYRLEADK